jgi:O-antigen ligase
VSRSDGTWADLQAWSFGSPARNALWVWGVVPLGCAIAIAFPLPFAVLTGLSLLFAWLWRRPESVLLLLVALMGNVKINYFAGALTVFPEYVALLVSCAVVALRALEGRREPFDRETSLWFAAWTFAGLMSFASAYNVGRVLSKTMLLPISALVFHWAHSSIQDDARLARVLRWFEVSVFLIALYGIAQMVGVFFDIDTSLSFLRRWGNPEFEYSVGAPVLYRLTSTFRANSLFNDPNILGGYLAASVPVLLSTALSPQWRGSNARNAFRWTVLVAVSFCLLLSLSRSGFLGAVCGVGVIVVWMPRRFLRPRLWLGLALIGAGVSAAALAIKVNPLVLFARITSSIGGEEYSARVHKDLVSFGLDLLWRHPLTGVGMRNFGEYYAREMDPRMFVMMAHNAYLTYFAESGLLGGCMFLGLLFTIGRRVLVSLRLPGLRERQPARFAVLAGLSGSLVALAVTNVFYDFSLRTFVWVFCGLAYGVARLVAREPAA